MERARRPWVRGAVVLGLAGTMMAAALMSPALAVRLATTSYVKQKVNQVNSLALTALRTPDYVQSTAQTLPPGTFGVGETTCGTRHVVSGGASSSGSGNSFILESYPADGNLTTLNVSGRNGWGVTVGNPSSSAVTLYLYAICADTSVSTGNVGGTARSESSFGKWSWTTRPMETQL